VENISEVRTKFFETYGKEIVERFKKKESLKSIIDAMEKKAPGKGKFVWYCLVRCGVKSYAAEKRMVEADKAQKEGKAKASAPKPESKKAKTNGKSKLKVANAKGEVVPVDSE
jgi:hypothetical protein